MPETNKVDIQYIKDNINFFDLANYFEEQQVVTSYNHIKFCCPSHKEKTPSFVYNIEKKFYKCFGCGETGDVIDYTKIKLRTGFMDSVKFLLKFMGVKEENFGITRSQSYKKQLRALSSLDKKKENDFDKVSEKDVSTMMEMRGSFWSDKYAKDTLDTFQVGFDPVENRVGLPIRDDKNTLCGYTGRTVYSDFKEKGIVKWKHYAKSNISENFFNIYNGIAESKLKNNAIIIVEGPKDAMWLWQNGFKNTIACLTNKITSVQKGLLLKNFMDVYLFLDGDSGGEVGKSAIYKEIQGYFNIFEVKIQDGKDPDDLSKEEIGAALKNAIKI